MTVDVDAATATRGDTAAASTPPSWTVVGDITLIAKPWVEALGELEEIRRSRTANAGTYSYCLDPATPILTADLQWIAVGDLVEGDQLAAFEENSPANDVPDGGEHHKSAPWQA